MIYINKITNNLSTDGLCVDGAVGAALCLRSGGCVPVSAQISAPPPQAYTPVHYQARSAGAGCVPHAARACSVLHRSYPAAWIYRSLQAVKGSGRPQRTSPVRNHPHPPPGFQARAAAMRCASSTAPCEYSHPFLWRFPWRTACAPASVPGYG